jgi:threonine/homoserine/homoserine lactone efflux protein
LAFITDFYLFLASVLLISLSGVLMPGPLFAVTIKKAAKSKFSGALIAVGHGIVEFPLMFLIFFVLSQFQIPSVMQVAVELVGGFLMVFMGIQAFRNRNREEAAVPLKRDSVFAGIYTTAVNAGFILVANHWDRVDFECTAVWAGRVYCLCGCSLVNRFLMVRGCGLADF